MLRLKPGCRGKNLTMKAVQSTNASGPDGLIFADVPPPPVGPEEIAVRVKATALNRADLLQTLGLYPAPLGVPANIPGLEYAGEVTALGDRVTRWKVGDAVMGLVAGGAWAEILVTHEREAMAIPAGLSFAQAAAIPEAFATAFDALILQAGVSVGTDVLIHAVGSGVGTAACQICRLFGARTIGTSRNPQKLERARQFGLEQAIAVTNGSFSAQVKQLTRGLGCEVALDLVGGDWFPETIDAMSTQGTLMLVGLVGGPSAQVPLRNILAKRLRIQGTALRSRSLEEKIALARTFEKQLGPAFVDGRLRPVIDEVLPMSEIRAGLQRLASNDTFGKVVVCWDNVNS
jgi:NADPH2:quinone reductase